ncbi:Protein root UVB sensitive 4 [Dionaea muscipula]
MLSSLRIPLHSPALRFPPKSSQFPSTSSLHAHHPIRSHVNNCSFKAFPISNSVKTTKDFDLKQFHEKGEKPGSKTGLPVEISESGRVSRYFWNGNCVELICLDGDSAGSVWNFEDGLRKWATTCGSGIRDFFIPKQVGENYIDYVKWKFLHRVFSSAIQVLATQAMFGAIGVGYARSLPAAAAMKWVLKDGLGRLSRCIYTASVGSAFDTNLKRVRFAASILFCLSIGVELMTPLFPHCFLLLASVANIAKQISLACYLATGSAVHRSFAIADNLGEVSAKAQIQTVCFDNLGLLLAVLLNVICKNNRRFQAGLPFLLYPIFSAIDLYGIYQALKHVHLQTLTMDRLEIILSTWIEFEYVPSPAQVSAKEGLNLLEDSGRQPWPIRIGSLDTKSQIPTLTMLSMKHLTKDDFYFICVETRETRTRHGILLCLREGARATDTIMGMLHPKGSLVFE